MPFNMRPAELILILAIILLIFGAKKLPDLARGIGQSLRIFRKEVKDMKDPDAGETVEAAASGTAAAAAETPMTRVPTATSPAEATAPALPAATAFTEPAPAPVPVPVTAGERA